MAEENVNEHINDDAIISDNIKTKDELSDSEKGKFKLPLGKALTIEETYNITASEKTKVIVFIGPFASGKTTIETTLYQLFQNNAVEDYFFAGSETLLAYEQRSYYTRTKSRESTSKTQRTSIGVEDIFLHLKLWNHRTKEYINFLFADMSGEEFESHIGDSIAMKKDYSFIRYVDHIVAVLDGNRISNKKYRNGTYEEIAQLLRTMNDADLISNRTYLQIAISKYDLVIEKAKSDPLLEEFVKDKTIELQNRLQDYFTDIKFFKTAAMPSNCDFDVGYGIKELLSFWCFKESNYILSFPKFKRNRIFLSQLNKLYDKIMGDSDE